jgi:hypothetical protein
MAGALISAKTIQIDRWMAMFFAALILLFSTALLFFYFQVTCQKILRRQFDREYFRTIAIANRLEFPCLRRSLEEFGAPVDYSQLRSMLRCDFLALTYLLKNVANPKQRYSRDERFLIFYFHWQLLLLAVRRLLRVSENRAILELTSILQYFANVVGQRVSAIMLGNFSAPGIFLRL